MNDQEWLAALRKMPPLTDEEWAAINRGGRLLGPDNYKENDMASAANRNRSIEEYLKNQKRPTPEQDGRKPMTGGSARRVEESKHINGGKRR